MNFKDFTILTAEDLQEAVDILKKPIPEYPIMISYKLGEELKRWCRFKGLGSFYGIEYITPDGKEVEV